LRDPRRRGLGNGPRSGEADAANREERARAASVIIMRMSIYGLFVPTLGQLVFETGHNQETRQKQSTDSRDGMEGNLVKSCASDYKP